MFIVCGTRRGSTKRREDIFVAFACGVGVLHEAGCAPALGNYYPSLLRAGVNVNSRPSDGLPTGRPLPSAAYATHMSHPNPYSFSTLFSFYSTSSFHFHCCLPRPKLVLLYERFAAVGRDPNLDVTRALLNTVYVALLHAHTYETICPFH